MMWIPFLFVEVFTKRKSILSCLLSLHKDQKDPLNLQDKVFSQAESKWV